ncbi:hypothetical protein HPC62_12360 [Thermoleptolyngbya sichuanensis A183]|uniref:Uncharacterized protein n=1 Tax=Thermoleptolyngbya sichuanensis A183 TaxID=2737172 RepID=A0A6M8BID9_9CYAN|nr:hypothetical protein [Thermoleptolyngbya sichuanensis]QKD82873.1 hypothetical protein HPC62_12360 [Thermoleptolyngbya sichuanensis A183]
MAKTYIRAEDLLKLLKISSQELIEIEKFFDAIPDDEWELEEGKDYRVVSSNGAREYTQSGAYTLARYLEATKKLSFWDSLKEWFLHTREKIRKSFVRKKILDNCASLMRRSDQYWVSQADAVAIFGTNIQTLRRMAECTQKSDRPLIKGQHYQEFIDEGGIFYSLEGIYRLSLAFSTELTLKNRRDECRDVGEEISPQVSDIIKLIESREKRISKCKEEAKRRDKKTCLVTGQKPDRYHRFNLAAHHLYSSSAYPHLADSLDNIITISEEVHTRFHREFMSGTGKPCTPDDFIKFVQQYYPENSNVIIWLEGQRRKLGQQEPLGKRNNHVLYLPLSRVI